VRTYATLRTPPTATFRPFRPFLTFLTFPSFLVACHHSSPSQQEKLRRQQASWEATAELTGELADRDALPQVYIRQVKKVVEQGKREVQQQAAQSPQ
jgi:hypothetical protein